MANAAKAVVVKHAPKVEVKVEVRVKAAAVAATVATNVVVNEVASAAANVAPNVVVIARRVVTVPTVASALSAPNAPIALPQLVARHVHRPLPAPTRAKPVASVTTTVLPARPSAVANVATTARTTVPRVKVMRRRAAHVAMRPPPQWPTPQRNVLPSPWPRPAAKRRSTARTSRAVTRLPVPKPVWTQAPVMLVRRRPW